MTPKKRFLSKLVDTALRGGRAALGAAAAPAPHRLKLQQHGSRNAFTAGLALANENIECPTIPVG